MCSIATSRTFRLCTRPHATASQSTTPPAVTSNAPRTPCHAAAPVAERRPTAPPLRRRRRPAAARAAQKGRHASTIGTALDVKNGIMRCATVTNTATMKPHKAVTTKVRARPGSSASTLANTPARRDTHPTAEPDPMRLAWMRSGSRSSGPCARSSQRDRRQARESKQQRRRGRRRAHVTCHGPREPSERHQHQRRAQLAHRGRPHAQPFGAGREQEAREEQRHEAEGHQGRMHDRGRQLVGQADADHAVELDRRPPQAGAGQHDHREEEREPVRRDFEPRPGPSGRAAAAAGARASIGMSLIRRLPRGRTACRSRSRPCGSSRARRTRGTWRRHRGAARRPRPRAWPAPPPARPGGAR